MSEKIAISAIQPTNELELTPLERSDTPEKQDRNIDDEAGALALHALAIGAADPERAKKVLRKIDLFLLPFLCITYGMHSKFES